MRRGGRKGEVVGAKEREEEAAEGSLRLSRGGGAPSTFLSPRLLPGGEGGGTKGDLEGGAGVPLEVLCRGEEGRRP